MGLLLAVLVGFFGAAATPAQIHDATRRVLDPDTYQTRLPGHPQPGEDPGQVARALERMGRRLLASPLAHVAEWLLWGLAIAAIAAFLGLLARDAWRIPGTGAVAGGGGGARGAPEGLTAPLADADVLAAAGRYAEAIHVLLLHTLEVLARQAAAPLAPAWTSREILHRLALPPTPRGALADLVGEAERCHFGDAAPSAGDFARCRQCFHTFVEAYGSG